ncbi:eCIS core domain-containing protein [Rhizobium phaseoli]|uniref:eCIS core domain-containing protein n=1 Tax=Rhizobium phaseoli TaxID=396 RepID=UPI0007E9BE0E|nr:DUF4157 domain-containing protein [Rhizobium phaseoli]
MSAIVDQYIQYLEQQGDGKWIGIPADISASISAEYPEINLNTVRIAQNIDTVHGQAITIGNDIFIPTDISFDNRHDLKLLFHELEHVAQYHRRGGVRPFLAEYIVKIPFKIIQRGSFEVHDDIDIEQAAITKSVQVANAAYGWDFRVTNNCTHPVSVAVNYLDINGDWVADGYWAAGLGEQFLLGDADGKDLHSKNRTYYFYAETTDNSGLSWNGALNKLVATDNRTLGFLQQTLSDVNADDLDINLGCP